jgi:exosome complex component RRP4
MNTEKKIVVPGDLITDQVKKLGQNVYFENNKIYSSIIGILSESNDFVSVIPLNGPYSPVVGDGIVAVVKDEVLNGYILEYNSFDDSFLLKSNIRKELSIGTVVFLRIKNIADNGSLEFDNINILPKARVFQTSPVKIPRLIGKNESMLNLFKEHLGGNIVIGKNGWIWYNSEDVSLAKRAFSLVVKNSQKSNLTNSVKDFFEKNKLK